MKLLLLGFISAHREFANKKLHIYTFNCRKGSYTVTRGDDDRSNNYEASFIVAHQ